ncbi:MAG TPA: IPT/TIG domain-containing protein [Candidatus Sulfopaludibacter sp.]|jgi:uncharacterized protein (TIGR03437 family)|nr:IPT/TIG domain-containing protein [Candidatus Sulfopaludibacter sp.]
MKLAKSVLLLAALSVFPAMAQTQTWDNSGNSMLTGTYYFRQVYWGLSSNADGTLADAAVAYGNITFSGAADGKYSMTVTFLDASSGVQRGTVQGTYSISASGYGFMSNQITGDVTYGLVNAQGIFVGSDTESQSGYNDLMIAAPVSGTLASASTFKGPYSISYMDLSSGTPVTTLNAMLQMNPDGAGNVSSVGVTGYVGGNGASKITQTVTGGKYIFSNGAGVVTFPNSTTALLTGQYYLYISPDGNFVFGGSPGGFDMFVGVRTGTATPALSGLYYQAGIDQNESTLSSGYALLDTYFGALSANAGSVRGHQRLLEVLSNGAPIDYTYADSYNVKSDGTYSTSVMNYVVGGDGIRIGSGIGPYLGINVALPAPVFSGPGVYLNPTGIVNAASYAPFTAAVAPGELLTLFGTNLASASTVAPAIPFPTTVGNVQVLINNVAAPIYYVSPTQISAIVPYGVTGGIAQVQVVNDGTASNAVSMFIGMTAPGIFTVPPGGLGYGATLHQDGSLVTTQNPAQPGETVSVFVTGLGAVSPTISDGAAGPGSTLSFTSNTITSDINGTAATVTFSGLAPGLAGLYQVNVTIPTGLTGGDNYLNLAGPDAYTSQVLIPIAGAATNALAHPTPKVVKAPRGTQRRRLKP